MHPSVNFSYTESIFKRCLFEIELRIAAKVTRLEFKIKILCVTIKSK